MSWIHRRPERPAARGSLRRPAALLMATTAFSSPASTMADTSTASWCTDEPFCADAPFWPVPVLHRIPFWDVATADRLVFLTPSSSRSLLRLALSTHRRTEILEKLHQVFALVASDRGQRREHRCTCRPGDLVALDAAAGPCGRPRTPHTIPTKRPTSEPDDAELGNPQYGRLDRSRGGLDGFRHRRPRRRPELRARAISVLDDLESALAWLRACVSRRESAGRTRGLRSWDV